MPALPISFSRFSVSCSMPPEQHIWESPPFFRRSSADLNVLHFTLPCMCYMFYLYHLRDEGKVSTRSQVVLGDVPPVSESSCQRDSSAHLRTDLAQICHSFTDLEQRHTRAPSPAHWQPEDDYEHVSIGELAPGSRKVFFLARVVNLYDRPTHSKVRESAKGCLKLLVKDDNALILVCSTHHPFSSLSPC